MLQSRKEPETLRPGTYTGFGYCCGGDVLEPRDCEPLAGRAQTCIADSPRPIECKRDLERTPGLVPCTVCRTPRAIASTAQDDLPPAALAEPP